LVTGAAKAERLREVLEGDGGRETLPAQLIAPKQGSVHWMVDAEAGGRLERTH
jgi:6-phosphogluconolactonase/glucosamine-6-phosphate isomerase/deaminase